MLQWFVLCSTALANAAASVNPATAWNFAFGSNLDVGTRNRRGLRTFQLAPACAWGWELTFSLQALPYIEPAFAALQPVPSGSSVCAHGLLLELDCESWLRLLSSEGVLSTSDAARLRLQGASLDEVLAYAQESRRVPSAGASQSSDPKASKGYQLVEVPVEPYNVAGHSNLPRTAYAFAPTDMTTASATLYPPSERYWRLLRGGARRHKLNRDYRDFLASFPRYLPSLLAPASIPALIASSLLTAAATASAFRTTGAGRRGPESASVWPRLEGLPAVGRGGLLAGPAPPAGVWDRFCSTPRDELLQTIEASVGQLVVHTG